MSKRKVLMVILAVIVVAVVGAVAYEVYEVVSMTREEAGFERRLSELADIEIEVDIEPGANQIQDWEAEQDRTWFEFISGAEKRRLQADHPFRSQLRPAPEPEPTVEQDPDPDPGAEEVNRHEYLQIIGVSVPQIELTGIMGGGGGNYAVARLGDGSRVTLAEGTRLGDWVVTDITEEELTIDLVPELRRSDDYIITEPTVERFELGGGVH